MEDANFKATSGLKEKKDQMFKIQLNILLPSKKKKKLTLILSKSWGLITNLQKLKG